MGMADFWPELSRLRHSFADQIESLDENAWNADSWCDGWRVRDVLGHLVHLAEATQVSMIRDVIREGGRPDRALSRVARGLGAEPVPDLTRRLRASAGGRFHVLGTPRAVALGEVLVHGSDALRPLSMELDARPADVAEVLDVYRRFGRLAFHAPSHRGVRLVATDLDWAHGDGPHVSGRAVDLLLLLANRRQVLSSLSGPGVASL